MLTTKKCLECDCPDHLSFKDGLCNACYGYHYGTAEIGCSHCWQRCYKVDWIEERDRYECSHCQRNVKPTYQECRHDLA